MQNTENDIVLRLPYDYHTYMTEVVKKARENPLLVDREVFFGRNPYTTYS